MNTPSRFASRPSSPNNCRGQAGGERIQINQIGRLALTQRFSRAAFCQAHTIRQRPSAQCRNAGRPVICRKTNWKTCLDAHTLGVTLFALVIQDGLVFAHQKQKEATIVSGSIEIDFKGKAAIIVPHSESQVLEPLAVPISGAKLLVDTLVVMIAEAEAVAAKQPNKQ